MSGAAWRDVSSLGAEADPTESAPRLARTPSLGYTATDGYPAAAPVSKPDGKADQIVQHFFSKTCHLISQSRMTHLSAPTSDELLKASAESPSGSSASVRRGGGSQPPAAGITRRASAQGSSKVKVNKWFNMELPEPDTFRSELKTWKSVSSLLGASPAAGSSSNPQPPPLIPPMVLDILLDTSETTSNQVLVLSDQRGKRVRVDPSLATSPSRRAGSHPGSKATSPQRGVRSPAARDAGVPTSVVLERWTLELIPSSSSATPSPIPDSPESAGQTELPTVYKHAIILFRSLYTLLRLLPAWSLHRRLTRQRRTGAGGLKVGCRMSFGEVEEEEEEGEVAVGTAITEASGEEMEGAKVTETVRFPVVATPIGSLALSCTYRLNADFSVEDIETLLSSRFIDEDFFKPTVASSRYREGESALTAGRPGSLPTAAQHTHRAFPSPTHSGSSSPPLTGLAPLPSYGSLSSRHHLTSAPLHSSHLNPQHHVERVAPTPSSSLGATPLPLSASPREVDRPSSISSSGRFSAYGTSAGGASVEPAFVSLSRARGASYTGAAPPGIQRLSSSPGSIGVPPARRPSFTSGSSSPIFRSPIAHLGTSPNYGGGAARVNPGGANPSPPSSLGLGFARQQQQVGGAVPSGPSGLSVGRGSPLAAAATTAGIGAGFGGRGVGGEGVASTSPNAGATAAPPSSLSTGVGIGIGLSSTTGPRPIPSPSSASPGAAGGAASRPYSYSGGSYSRSYGSSAGSGGFGIGYGGRIQQRGPSGGGGAGGGAEEEKDPKRFLEGREDDSGEINDFLSLIDARPELGGGVGSGSAVGGGSMLMSKAQVEEQLKALRGSVYAGEGPAAGSATSGLGILGRTTSLRRQTSRLSIEEEREPALPGGGGGGSYSPGSGSAGRRMASGEMGGFGTGSHPPPRIVRRPLGEVMSPPPPSSSLSAQSTPTSTATTALHPAPPSRSPNNSNSNNLELPLPSLAHPHPHPSRFYLPPSTSSSASSSPAGRGGGVPTFTQYISSRSRAPHATTTTRTTTGFDLSRGTEGEAEAEEGEGEGEASLSASSTIDQAPSRGEEEVVGRLELSAEEGEGEVEASERRGRWRLEEAGAGEDELLPPLTAGQMGVRSRDRTPGASVGYSGAATRHGSGRRGAGVVSPPRGDYFAEHGGTWMG